MATDATVPVVKVGNVDDHEAWCDMCGNTGWVELVGSVRVFGITYSRGHAPCRWCQVGLARYVRATGAPRDRHDHHRPWTPESHFGAEDVVAYGPRDPRAARAAAPIVHALPGLEDAPVRDFESAARTCYAAWRRYLGKDHADRKVRASYPDQADAVIVEADALEVPAEPELESEDEPL